MHLSDWMQRVDLGKEIQEVYLHSFLFKLAVKTVSIFLPLFILDLGYGFSTVFVFFAVYYSSYIFTSWPNAEVVSRIGYKHSSLLSSPFILVFYLLLRSEPSTLVLYGTGFLGGSAFNLYWMGMNPEIATSSHRESREKETGFFFSMPSLASIISPFAGGLVLASFGFHGLFLLASALIAASFTPFLFSSEHSDGLDLDLSEFLRDANPTDFLTFTLKGVNSIGKKVLWPLYLALVIQSSLSIGGAGSLLSLGSAITSIFLGRITNSDNRRQVILTGSALTGLSYLLMSSVTSTVPALAVSFINGLAYNAVNIPVYSRAQDHAENEDVIEYFALREIALSVGRCGALGVAAALFYFLPETRFLASFTFVAASVVLTGYFGGKM
ncbi:MAG: MFS transporter [Candidatus Nanohaloarchaea archaeon]